MARLALKLLLSTHPEPHRSVMPVRSPEEQPARPSPEAAAAPPPPSLQLGTDPSQPPPSNPRGAATTDHNRGVRARFCILPRKEQRQSGPLLSSSSSSVLENSQELPHSVAASRPAASSSTDSLGDTGRERRREVWGGGG